MARHFLNILDIPQSDIFKVLERAKALKDGDVRTRLLDGKTVILIFEKASTRTRVSFEVAVRHLGGSTVFLTPHESQLGRNEPLKDTARVLSRYADALVVRTFGQEKLDTLVQWGSIPVVNALTDEHHPCQVMSDVLTMFERTPDLCSLKVGWIGDGNNMAHSWIEAAARFHFELTLACPSGYTPDLAILAKAREQGARIVLTEDPELAAKDADYLNTDVWASMGQEAEQLRREAAFEGYQLNDALLKLAKPGCKVMHCLPAHRGEEITDEVFEANADMIFDEAENRLHMQKAILEWVFEAL
ncbi:MAG: ornithine carbamoyltransferase [Humidesulfovibrio sp.]|uniref:ornithine carbamoyltransferase n=1 Tax=Humidesulfovibrio sp. TaxID=2910988 RepID=UPI0027EF1DB8|nr:ornithine carbamoyltransferase [Humidesulfovibrio sp.]MDQ7835850.1 ornithine carbamoyltransferase [Humidesulfovibrio sp.]